MIDNVTLAVSYYKDSPTRAKNLENFLKYYQDSIKIDILESTYPHVIMENYNKLADRCSTKYIAFIDVDAILPLPQITASIKLLNSCDFVSPFNCFFDITDYTIDKQNITIDKMTEIFNEDLHDKLNVEYNISRDIRYIGKTKKTSLNVKQNNSWESPFFVGLCVVTKLETYYEFGMGNENFFVYGGADDEWYARAEKLGYNWQQLQGNIYHMNHERIFNKHNELLYKNNLIELMKILTFDKLELVEYLKRCHWIKSRPNALHLMELKHG